MELNREQVLQAFNMAKLAINAAMSGSFPMGLDHVEYHSSLKQNLAALAQYLNVTFQQADPEQADAEATAAAAVKKED